MRDRFFVLLFRMLPTVRRLAPRLLLAMSAVLALTGPFAFQVEAVERGKPIPFDEALYWTLSLFAVQSSPLGYPQHAYLKFLHFLAPALAASALFGAVVRILEERGPIFLGRFQRHTIIGGLGTLGTTLSRYLMKHGHQVIAVERQGDAPAVADMREAGASLVLVGDMASGETLRRVRAQFAEAVFFVSRSDVANLDAAFQVRRLCAAERVARPPVVYAHVFDAALGDALEGQLVGQGGCARIITFNSYRFAAKALIGDLLREQLLGAIRISSSFCLLRTDWPKKGEPPRPETHEPRAAALDEDRKRLMASYRIAPAADVKVDERFVVVGLGRFGRTVLRELLTVAPSASRFLVVERSAHDANAGMENLSESERGRCELLAGDATTGGTLDQVVAFQPTAVLVCTDNDLSNLRMAAALKRRHVRAMVRMSGPDAAELSRGLEEQGIAVVGFSRLFRAAIPILTHERRLRACMNLDVNYTTDVDHLFYLAQATPGERERLGPACVRLHELPGAPSCGELPDNLVLVWHREAMRLTEDDVAEVLNADAQRAME